MELTKNEMQFMTVLWEAGTPLTASDILDRVVDREWHVSSVHKILNNLLKKGAVELDGNFVQEGRNISRTFVPMLARVEYYEIALADYDPVDMVSALHAIMESKPERVGGTVKKMEDVIRDLRTVSKK